MSVLFVNEPLCVRALAAEIRAYPVAALSFLASTFELDGQTILDVEVEKGAYPRIDLVVHVQLGNGEKVTQQFEAKVDSVVAISQLEAQAISHLLVVDPGDVPDGLPLTVQVVLWRDFLGAFDASPTAALLLSDVNALAANPYSKRRTAQRLRGAAVSRGSLSGVVRPSAAGWPSLWFDTGRGLVGQIEAPRGGGPTFTATIGVQVTRTGWEQDVEPACAAAEAFLQGHGIRVSQRRSNHGLPDVSPKYQKGYAGHYIGLKTEPVPTERLNELAAATLGAVEAALIAVN
jgi:hypothetical protein